MAPRRLAGGLAVLAALLAVACQEELPPIPTACREGTEPVAQALRDAPGAVTLADGTPISACVRNARDDAELQEVGLLLTTVAEDLEERAASDPRAALELGYLVGAARRGAEGDASVQSELVYRLERSAVLDGSGGDVQAAVQRGLQAGEARG
jgi:hypothetical protein